RTAKVGDVVGKLRLHRGVTVFKRGAFTLATPAAATSSAPTASAPPGLLVLALDVCGARRFARQRRLFHVFAFAAAFLVIVCGRDSMFGHRLVHDSVVLARLSMAAASPPASTAARTTFAALATFGLLGTAREALGGLLDVFAEFRFFLR